MKILKVVLSLFLLGFFCTEAMAQSIDDDGLYKTALGVAAINGYAANKSEDIVQGPLVSPRINLPTTTGGSINIEETFKESGIARGFTMPQPVTGMTQTFSSTDYLNVLNNNLGSPLSLWHIAQIQTEPAVASGFNAARAASADLSKLTYMSENNFRQSMDLYPETRQLILSNLNGCINTKVKAGSTRSSAVLKCFGDSGVSTGGNTILGSAGEAFQIQDHPEAIAGSTSVLVSDLIFSRLGKAAPGAAQQPTLASGDAAILKQSFLEWFGDYKFEYAAANGASKDYKISKIAQTKTIQDIHKEVMEKRYEDLGEILKAVCKESLKTPSSTGVNSNKYKGSIFEIQTALQIPQEHLSMPGLPFTQILAEMLWQLAYGQHKASLRQGQEGDCDKIEAFDATKSMDIKGSTDQYHDQKLWYRKFIEFVAADQLVRSYQNMERVISKAISEEGNGADSVIMDSAYNLIYDVAGTRDLATQRSVNRTLYINYIAELGNKIAKNSGVQGGNLADAAATKSKEQGGQAS